FVLVDHTRPTTAKHRFVGRASDRHPHQILRVDHESRAPLSESITADLWARLKDMLPQFDAILVSDYLKGVCTEPLLQSVITAARANGQQKVLIDPGRTPDYSRYRGATLLKPNRLESELAAGHVRWTSSPSRSDSTETNPPQKPTINSTKQALQTAHDLRKAHKVETVIITLDREGLVVVTPTEQVEIPTEPRAVYDITGAGDMVLAALGLCLANGVNVFDAARIANLAAGLEVERFGITPVTRQEITAVAATQSVSAPANIRPKVRDKSHKKLVTTEEVTQLASEYRNQGQRIVFTNGCFDLLHVGHVSYLKEAAALGDILIVAVNSDNSVRRLKGPTRPIIPDRDRATLLAALECVDHVVIFDADTPVSLLHKIHPDILIKGGTTDEIVGREIVEAYGGQVLRAGTIAGLSTTQLISTLQTESQSSL
ncbi:MAG: D-alpha,beta-D-heptose 7-phosphate 1-kinase, partial [Planctomycetaceae bacterium]|nr:D-alpha,beta-D-heptose 7-phosphate 1-kinase [Planctomycetaceae bacterium]